MAYSVAHVGYIDNSLVLSWVQRSVGLIALLAQGWLLGLPKIFELIGLTAILSNGGMDYRSDEVFNDSHGQWDALQTQLNHVPLFKVKIKFISLAVFDDRPSRGSQTLDADSAELLRNCCDGFEILPRSKYKETGEKTAGIEGIEPKPLKVLGELPAYWPASGELKIENLPARYSPEGPNVLHELSLTIRSGERVGIDHRTDAFIQDIFRRELSGDATVITIAHRLEMIMDADRVVEDGNPQDLLKMQHDHLHALVGDSPNKEELFATIH
uniref:ABC transporter domain-containing protein n=1 Tax=Moniliophthora roreri TaxID=221103 RepID=A0A0W0FAJ6_MONRR